MTCAGWTLRVIRPPAAKAETVAELISRAANAPDRNCLLYTSSISYNDATPSLPQAIRLKEFSKAGKLSAEVIEAILGEEKPNQKEKIYRGTATRADITRITRRLGDEIGKVYGWDFPKQSLSSVQRDAR